jgi:hypothetical protein
MANDKSITQVFSDLSAGGDRAAKVANDTAVASAAVARNQSNSDYTAANQPIFRAAAAREAAAVRKNRP